MLKQAEKNHYHELFEKHKDNIKKSWSLIKDIVNKKKHTINCSKFNINGNITTNKKQIADGFNTFFTEVGPMLAKNIKDSNVDPTSYINDVIRESIFITPVTNVEVEKIILCMKNSAAGWDDIKGDIIKKCYPLFIDTFTHICNISLINGVFPDELKIAKVIPLYKGESKSLVTNYRPVSVLPYFSKILERLMYNRLLNFINKHNVLYKYQFGFRKKYSTSMALIVLLDKISDALQNGEFVLGVFLDFKKAFDTVNHSILCRKLELYGIRGNALNWIKNYLYNRHQYVHFAGESSNKRQITCGVPQGSILGPLLFLLYINDIVNVSKLLFPLIFADDTNVFLKGKDPEALINIMNVEIKKLCVWLDTNKLTLNVVKTNFMLFLSKGKKHPRLQNVLKVKNEIVKEVTHTKFLGVFIDNRLNWSYHIKKHEK